MVSSGPKALLMVISPSAAIARTPNKKHIAAINAKVASLVGGLTTLSISLSFRPAGMVEPTNPSCAAAKTIAHKTPLHCGISNPSMSGLGQKRRSQSSPRFLLFPLCPRNRTSDLHVDEYELPLDRLREAPSRSRPAAGTPGADHPVWGTSAEFPCHAGCQTNARSERECSRKFSVRQCA